MYVFGIIMAFIENARRERDRREMRLTARDGGSEDAIDEAEMYYIRTVPRGRLVDCGHRAGLG